MFKSKLLPEEKEMMLQWASEGVGYTEIASRLGNKVSRQRIKQICKSNGVDAFQIGREKRLEERENRMIAKWGTEWNNPSVRKSYIYQSMRAKFRNKRANAVRSGKEWTIEFGDLSFPTHCPVLNIPLNYFSEQRCENSPSFDRINPSLGYVKGNVAVISWRANRIKNDGSAEEHRLIAEWLGSSEP